MKKKSKAVQKTLPTAYVLINFAPRIIVAPIGRPPPLKFRLAPSPDFLPPITSRRGRGGGSEGGGV